MKLNFTVPFSGFAGATFINCFASVYLFLEGTDTLRYAATYCNQWEKGICNGCGHCQTKPNALQEKYFFLFDTMCGHSSLRCRFDGERTAMDRLINDHDFYDGGSRNNIDFLFGLAGWDYRILTDPAAFSGAITASLSANKPVLIRLRDHRVPFAVLIGQEDGAYIYPDFKGAQDYPRNPPTDSDIAEVYLVGNRIAPRYGLADGLRRIQMVMEYNAAESLWGGYMERLGKYGPQGLDSADAAERRAHMKRVAETMWHTFNSHNFAEVFRAFAAQIAEPYARVGDMAKLQAPAFAEAIKRISYPLYGYTHDLAWALIELEACADWDKGSSSYFGEMVELTLRQIRDNDAGVLDCVREMLRLLAA